MNNNYSNNYCTVDQSKENLLRKRFFYLINTTADRPRNFPLTPLHSFIVLVRGREDGVGDERYDYRMGRKIFY
jgi:hypothetical protein